MEKVLLNNGVKMPRLGFGVCRIDEPKECEEVVKNALAVGYRSIDTASIYGNEAAVGKALQNSGVPREEVFLPIKLWPSDYGYWQTKRAFEEALRKLKTDYIDLFLLHYPIGDVFGSWQALEEFYHEGKIRAIGVSNFQNDRLLDLILHSQVKPAVNQLQTHPFLQLQTEQRFLQEQAVQLEAWSPFAVGQNNIFTHPLLREIASNHRKSVAQIILRWHLQRESVVIPKSVQVKRMEENFAVWDFTLAEAEMKMIASMDEEAQQQALIPETEKRIQTLLKVTDR